MGSILMAMIVDGLVPTGATVQRQTVVQGIVLAVAPSRPVRTAVARSMDSRGMAVAIPTGFAAASLAGLVSA